MPTCAPCPALSSLPVLAYFIAAISPNLDVANALLPTYVVTLLFFGGFLFRFEESESCLNCPAAARAVPCTGSTRGRSQRVLQPGWLARVVCFCVCVGGGHPREVAS